MPDDHAADTLETTASELGLSGRDIDALLELGELAIDVLTSVDAHEILAAVTPERLAERAGVSPSTIRYRLGRVGKLLGGEGTPDRPAWRFDRSALTIAVVHAVSRQRARASEASVRDYLPALEHLAASGDLRAVGAALMRDLARFSPGATDGADGADGDNEGVVLLLLALCEADRRVAGELRRLQDARLQHYRPVYEAILAMTGRQLREGVTIDALITQLNYYLEGLSHWRRTRPTADQRLTLSTAAAIIHAHTVPAESPDAPSPLDVLLAAIRAPEAPPPSPER